MIGAPSPMAAPPESQPHLDPASWGKLIDSLDIAGIFVVLAVWLGPKLRGEVAIEDLWQETLWLAWRDRQQHDWRGLTAYRSWLLTIAHNRVRDAARSLGRLKRGGGERTALFSHLAAEMGRDSAYLPPASTTPSRLVGHRERARLMQRALDALDDDLRQIVHLRLFEEVPTREIAERLGMALSTTKERLLRGMQQYRRHLRRNLPDDSIVTPADSGPG